MKKFTSVILIALMSATLFAASFKKGQTVYLSKDGTITESEKSSKALLKASKGDFGIVVESGSKKTKITFTELGIEGWVENKSLTKKKVVKVAVVTNVDNLALSGKGSVSASSLTVQDKINQVEEKTTCACGENCQCKKN